MCCQDSNEYELSPYYRLCDYETALRDRLKLRKNLNKKEWYYIGVQIAIRKSQGKETDVMWNNSPMDPKKVHKHLKNVSKNGLHVPRRPRHGEGN